MQPKRNSAYQRRTGKLSTRQKYLLDNSRHLLRDHNQIVSSSLFTNRTPLYCEIGFGKGQYLLKQAHEHPKRNYIGIDLYLPGVSSVLGQLEDTNLDNIKLIAHDAFSVATTMFAPQSLTHVALLHPDPWPKKRHHKRRLITVEFLTLLASRIHHNGHIQIVSDDASYTEWIANCIQALPYEYQQHHNIEPFTKYGDKAMTYENTITEFIVTVTHEKAT